MHLKMILIALAAVAVQSLTPMAASAQVVCPPSDRWLCHSGNGFDGRAWQPRSFRGASYESGRAVHGSNARPSRWCGWWMRQRRGVSDTRYNLARMWRNYGRPTSPHVGAIVVWNSHVGEITSWSGDCSRTGVISGNDGGGVRNRIRSVCGATFRA